MSADVDIDAWLTDRGYGLAATKALARSTLEAAGLTRPGKTRLSTEKLDRAAAELSQHLVRHCPTAECAGWAKASGRTPVSCESKTQCERCGGSDNRRAVSELLEACRRSGVHKLLVVGGSPSVREELTQAIGDALELRLVDGTERRTTDKARADLDWADLALLWGATELHHKVSTLYSNAPAAKAKLVLVQKRGIGQLLAAAVSHLSR